MALLTSFVFCETTLKQINDLPEDLRLKFYEAVANYGIYKIEPHFTGLENTIWISMKDIIDTTKARRKIKQRAGKAGGEAKRDKAKEKRTKQDVAEGSNPYQALPNGNGNGNGNVNVNVNGNGNGNAKKPPPLSFEQIKNQIAEKGFFIDDDENLKGLIAETDPEWFQGGYTFIDFIADKVRGNYKKKPEEQQHNIFRKLLFGAENLRREYPLRKQERGEKEADKKQAEIRKREARDRAYENKPSTCLVCEVKLDKDLKCPKCEGTYMFNNDTCEWDFITTKEISLSEGFRNVIKRRSTE